MPSTAYENLQKLSEGPKLWSYGTSQVSQPGPGVPAPDPIDRLKADIKATGTQSVVSYQQDSEFITKNLRWLSRQQLAQIISWIKERHPSS